MTHINGNMVVTANKDMQRGMVFFFGNVPVGIALEDANAGQEFTAAIIGCYIGTVEILNVAEEPVEPGKPVVVEGHYIGVSLSAAKPGELFEIAHTAAVPAK